MNEWLCLPTLGPKKGLKNEKGFSLVDILLAISISILLTALAIKPITGFIQRIKAKSVNEGIKHYLQMVRSRAIANPNRHCGVVFKLHAPSTLLDDSVIAFYDVPANNVYDKGVDSLYSHPFVIPRKENVTIVKSGASPTSIVFRGDGSANSSIKIDLTLKHIQSTLDVLASTGRVKVVMK